jgi:hypothetical protein
MNTRRLLPIAILALSTASLAQTAPPSGAPPTGAMPPGGQTGQRRPGPPPTNLQVLPKDMTREQVVGIMHKWEGDLGVECEYGHAKNPSTGRLDFASDANPKKDTARLMLRMNMTINNDYVAKVTPPAENKVTCGTCHRGMAKPTVFIAPQRQRQGPPPAAPPAGTPPPSGN